MHKATPPEPFLFFDKQWSIGNTTVAVKWLLLAAFVLIALAELGQDFMSALIRDSYFSTGESLVFKSFWLLFIPSTYLMIYGYEKLTANIPVPLSYLSGVCWLLFTVASHLLAFSVVLQWFSIGWHADPWTLEELVLKKLSTRLYLVLLIHGMITVAWLWLKFRTPSADEPNGEIRHLTVEQGSRKVIVPVDEIQWIGVTSGCTVLHTEQKSYVISDSLKSLESYLPDNRFRRIHKSSIVNMDYVREFSSRHNGDYDLILEDGRTLRLSRNYASPLKGTWL